MTNNHMFYVEAIIDERAGKNGRTEYLVKWTGYPDEIATWEPRRNVEAVLIAEWDQRKARLEEMDLDLEEFDKDTDVDAELDASAVDGSQSQQGNNSPQEGYNSPQEGINSSDPVTQTTQGPRGAEQRIKKITGETETEYQVEWKPDPISGEVLTSEWIPKAIIDRASIANWKELKHELSAAMGNWAGDHPVNDDPTGDPPEHEEPEPLGELAAFEYTLSETHVFIKRKELTAQPSNVPDGEPFNADGQAKACSGMHGDADMVDAGEEVSQTLDTSTDEQEADQAGNEEAVLGEQPANFNNNNACNDPASEQLEVFQHSRTTHLCESDSHNHERGYRPRTCVRCFHAAVSVLDDSQRGIYEHSATLPLCQMCADLHLDQNADESAQCKCLTEKQCCFCFWTAVDMLMEVKIAANERTEVGQCFDCAASLEGTEIVFRCAKCSCLKIR